MKSHFLLERSIETAALFGGDGLMVDDNGSHPVCCLWRVLERERSRQGRAEKGRAEQGITSTVTKMNGSDRAIIHRDFEELRFGCWLGGGCFGGSF